MKRRPQAQEPEWRASSGESARHTAPRTALLSSAWRARAAVSALVLSDALLALFVWAAAYALQGFLGGEAIVSSVTVASVLSSVALWVALRGALGMYPAYGIDTVELLRRHTYSVFMALAILSVLALVFQVGVLLSRLLVGLAFVGLLFAAPVVRRLVMVMLRNLGLWGRAVIVLSYKGTGVEFVELLKREWGLGYRPVALFDYNLVPAGTAFEDTSYSQTLSDAEEFARRKSIDTAIFATPYTRREQLADMMGQASESFRYVLIVPNLGGVTNSAVIARDFAGTLAIEIKHNLLDPWARRLKRSMDLLLVGVGGLLISPLLLLIAVLVKMDSSGPAFFTQQRPGSRGGSFKIFKFRTMHTDAEERMVKLYEETPELAEEFRRHGKLRRDPRVTRVGRVLRKFSLDELPQIWNVLKGEMSLVGPRPYLGSQREEVSESEAVILRVPPGISGLWQVSGRSDTSMEERVNLDVYYVRNWSVWLDIVILTRTLGIVVRSRGAY